MSSGILHFVLDKFISSSSAHAVKLAMQDLIGTFSKARLADDDTDQVGSTLDFIAIVRSIAKTVSQVVFVCANEH